VEWCLISESGAVGVSCAYKGKEGKELLKYRKVDEKEGLVVGFFTAPGAYFNYH
jgi:hypothetical protein